MNWLFEDFGLLVGLAVVAEAVLAFVLVKSGQVRLLWAMGGVLLVAAAALFIERNVVTQGEEVERTLDSIAAAVEADSVEGVIAHVDPQAAEIHDRIRWAMAQATIHTAHFGGLRVTVDDDGTPVTAKADCVVRVQIDNEDAQYLYAHYVRRFVFTLKRDGDKWLIVDYEVGDARGGSTSHDAY